LTHLPELTFEALLEKGEPLVLDGGLATQLESQGHSLDSPLWSAELLIHRPDEIVQAHRAFLEAGADCLISASYQLSRAGLRSTGADERCFPQLLEDSVLLAMRARDEFVAGGATRGFLPLVAASVGPYGAALADGSEYTGAYGVEDEVLHEFHSERLEVLDRSGADVLACETIPSRQEAEVLEKLLRGKSTPSWVSFSCRDSLHLCDGSPLRSVAEMFEGHPQVLAIGVNCTAPRFVSGLIDELRTAVPTKRIVVYPNSGEEFNALRRSWEGSSDPQDCASAARTWRSRGAQLVGGCCRMGPDHIRALNAARS
jgi:homocysteine S-methyltransferase